MAGHEIMYVDIAAFAVEVERLVHPELRKHPVLVAPVATARPVVTALSQEAWDAGVRKGMILAGALRRCRDAVVLPPNRPLYARATRALCEILAGFSPVLEPFGYGHAWLDITGTGRLLGPARDAAWRAQQEIRRQLRLETSVGVAANKLVSRIAATVSKPAGLQDVRPGDEASFLAPLPARLLPGVGPATERLLAELNIRIIGELAAMNPDHLALAFGRFGFVLHRHACGIDPTPVHPPRTAPALVEEETLAEDSNDREVLASAVAELCARAGESLRRGAQAAGRMELHVRYADGREAKGAETLAPRLQSSSALQAHAVRLLERTVVRRTRVRAIRLQLEEIVRGPVQRELFSDPGVRRRAGLEAALDELRRRYGPAAVFSPRPGAGRAAPVLAAGRR